MGQSSAHTGSCATDGLQKMHTGAPARLPERTFADSLLQLCLAPCSHVTSSMGIQRLGFSMHAVPISACVDLLLCRVRVDGISQGHIRGQPNGLLCAHTPGMSGVHMGDWLESIFSARLWIVTMQEPRTYTI